MYCKTIKNTYLPEVHWSVNDQCWIGTYDGTGRYLGIRRLVHLTRVTSVPQEKLEKLFNEYLIKFIS